MFSLDRTSNSFFFVFSVFSSFFVFLLIYKWLNVNTFLKINLNNFINKQIERENSEN